MCIRDRNIKILKSDRDGEYESNDFSELYAKFGIIHQTATPYTPWQNEIAERKNKTLKEMVNSMLVSSDASQNLWGEALLNVNYILNKYPTRNLVLYHLNYGMEEHLPTITSKCGGPLQSTSTTI